MVLGMMLIFADIVSSEGVWQQPCPGQPSQTLCEMKNIYISVFHLEALGLSVN